MTEYVTVWRDHEPTKLHWGVPVVRCRDCVKWLLFDTKDGKRIGECTKWAYLDGFTHATREDGFCAWGERRDA